MTPGRGRLRVARRAHPALRPARAAIHVVPDRGRVHRRVRRERLSRVTSPRRPSVDAPLSLYLHLPFCEERCSFCGCSVIITKKHEVAQHYLDYLHREIDMLAAALGRRRRLVQYHWGGGTPTYLTPPEIAALHERVTRHFEIEPGAEVAIEVDPRVTTVEQLALHADAGIQPAVDGRAGLHARSCRRPSTASSPRTPRARCSSEARRLGFGSINIDLIYGLPFQTRESFARTLDAVIDMRPDRVAVYSYAHVPWIRGNQKRIDPADLPPAEPEDRAVRRGEVALRGGRLPADRHGSLRAARRRAVARVGSKAGCTATSWDTRRSPAPDMVAAGVSGIGDVRGAFTQNTKKLSTYYQAHRRRTVSDRARLRPRCRRSPPPATSSRS